MNFVDLAPIIIVSPSIGRAQGGFVESQRSVGAWRIKVVQESQQISTGSWLIAAIAAIAVTWLDVGERRARVR